MWGCHLSLQWLVLSVKKENAAIILGVLLKIAKFACQVRMAVDRRYRGSKDLDGPGREGWGGTGIGLRIEGWLPVSLLCCMLGGTEGSPRAWEAAWMSSNMQKAAVYVLWLIGVLMNLGCFLHSSPTSCDCIFLWLHPSVLPRRTSRLVRTHLYLHLKEEFWQLV